MKVWTIGEECWHGGLGRKCEICLRDEELKELRASLEELRALLKEAEKALVMVECVTCKRCSKESYASHVRFAVTEKIRRLLN